VRRTASFFTDLPKTEDQWCEKRKSARLSSEEDILFTARCLATARLKSIPFTDHTQKPDLQDSLICFAENVREALAGSNSYSNISHFLSLIFVATCCVAKKKGYPVDDAQRNLIEVSRGKCDKALQPLLNDRASVIWLLQEMQRQFRRGLRQRAFELFFLSTSRSVSPRISHPGTYLVTGGKGLAFYGQCPKEADENAIFTNKIPLCDVPEEVHASLPLWIPFFVKLHVGDRWR
jgi:hypothetical protein